MPLKTMAVSYHIPRLRETHRHQVWAEVSGNRLWFLDADTFEQIPISQGAVTYRRLRGAVGIRIGEDGAPFAHHQLARFEPNLIVLMILVRQDGYPAFRTLRKQAWAHGYSVNWTPLDSAEEIVLSPASRGFEQ